MRKFAILFLIIAAFLGTLVACQPDTPVAEQPVLTVTDGTTEEIYTTAELEEMETAEASANGETYVGVPLAELLAAAGLDPAGGVVTAVASDGFSATYTPEQVARPDTLVAYARQGGDLAGDEQPFRMVLPDERGQLNVRMLTRIEVAK